MVNNSGRCGKRRLERGFGFTPKTAKYRLRESNQCNADDRNEQVLYDRNSPCAHDYHSRQHKSFPPNDYEEGQTTCKMSTGRKRTNERFANKEMAYTDTEPSSGQPKEIQRNDSQLDNISSSVDIDTILPHDQHFSPISPEQLKMVNPDYFDSASLSGMPKETLKLGPWKLKSQKTKTKQEDEIYILHKELTDTVTKDKFGARLVSFKPSDDYKYHRHFLCGVAEGLPALKMKLKDEDELVLVNDAFVPALTHAAILHLFRNVKVDGKTRFCLVIRRCVTTMCLRWSKKKTFQWIETSAVLAPEYIVPEPGTAVYRERFNVSEEKYIYQKSCHKFQVKGISEYLSISPSNGILATANTQYDEETTIVVDVRVWFADRSYHNETSLYTEHDGQCWYLNIDGEQVKASKECQWIQYKQPEGTFSFNENYVACNKNTRCFVALPKTYLDQNQNIYSYVFKDLKINDRNSRGLDEPDLTASRSPAESDTSDTSDENGDDSVTLQISSSQNWYDNGRQPSNANTSGNEERLHRYAKDRIQTFVSGINSPKTPNTPMGLLKLF